MSADGQRTKWYRNIAENFNRLSRVHERYRQTTDGRPMTYSECELEFTFAKKQLRRIKTSNDDDDDDDNDNDNSPLQ